MKGFLFSFLLPLFLLAGYALKEVEAAQPGGGSTREAIARGEVREVLSAMEAKAFEAERNSDWAEASNSYREAANSARLSGQLQKAVAYGTKALEMGEKAGAPGLQAGAIWHLAFAYRMLRQHDRAREWIEKGIEVTKQMGDEASRPVLQANLYRELGWNLLQRGEPHKAIEHLSQSLQILEARLAFLKTIPPHRLKSPQVIPNIEQLATLTLDGLGFAYQRAGNAEEAIKTYDKALSIIKESGLKTPVEVNLYHRLGELYRGQKEFTRSLENLQKALEMAEKVNHASFIYLASSQIGNLLLETERPSEAIPYYEKAIENIESTRSLLESEEFRSSFFEDKRTIYSGMIIAHLRMRNPKATEEAFNYNERARSRAFLDILGSKVQLARGGTLLEHERALQARISVLQAMMVGQEPDAPERPQLRRELEEAQKAYNDFLVKVRKENREQASLMNVEPLTLKQLQELLDPGVTMLEYFVVRGAVFLWVVEKDRLRFVRIPIARSELVAKVTSLRENIFQIGARERFRGDSQELYKLLIEPALPHVRGKELLIIPHDVLHYLPYQALLSTQDRYLIQDYPIYYLSSASLMQFTREKRRASRESRERALVMGNPSLGDEAYNLRFAEREAKEVAAAYPKSTVYLQSDATKPRAISLSPDYDILHFAVHGELKEDDPLGSGLLLASDGKENGRLEAREIFSLNLKADMVVLSACETGLGKITNGDEIIGLTRAFIYAGTPSVVTTLWKVNDRASYELMREFYSNLKSAKKSEALRQAQLKIMRQFPEPFFWAAYGLTGEP